MLFKKFLRYFSFALVLGAILILGFLAFSGIYVLTPILPLAVAAFFLSVVFEGEIFYQNISKAIKSLIKPHYIESKLAEECLQEAIEDISAEYELISAIDDFICTINNNNKKTNQEKLHEELTLKYKAIQIACANNNLQKYDDLLKALKSDELLNRFITKTPETINFASKQKSVVTIDPLKELQSIKNNLLINNKTPVFFLDYARIATIEHSFAHVNPTQEAKNQRKSLNVTLKMLEKIFTEELFSHTKPQVDSKQPVTQDIYKSQLKDFLQKKYVEKYRAKLINRQRGSIFIKALSTVCASLMMLGTSYLLVEAFAVVPLLSAIPFGLLPAVVVPLAVLAGIAYGMQTYRALDEMLNSDVITKRLAKIREDIKNGLNFYTATKLLMFGLLLGLAITLTICTGGTWYTVMKHTKPLFTFLSKIPAAVMMIIAGFLAVASFAFNVSNSAQTSEELEEAFESQAPEDNPYNIDLFEIDANDDIEAKINFIERTAIIKQGGEYFIHCCPNGSTWQRIKVSKDAFLLNALLNRIDFSKNILYYSAFNTALYSLIRKNTAHKFNPSKENWIQFFNPFRGFLLVTYVPIRILFFIGHLASISATSDRIPGIPDVISMMIGFVAELFEDLHYFTSFEHNHKENVTEIVAEHFKDEDGCDHANDLPTRVLRDYLFFPIFWLAAAWHSNFSKKISGQEIISTDKRLSGNDAIIKEPTEIKFKPSITHENALEMLRGKKPMSTPDLQEDDKEVVNSITGALDDEQKRHQEFIEDTEDLVLIPESCEAVVKTLHSLPKKPNPFRIFTGKDNGCSCHAPQISRNQILLQ